MFISWNEILCRFGPLAQGIIGMCIILGCEGQKERILRDLRMERLGITQPLMIVFKVNKFRVKRSYICGGEKIRLGLACPLGFYFSHFILTALLQRWLFSWVWALKHLQMSHWGYFFFFLVGVGVGGVGWESLSLPSLFLANIWIAFYFWTLSS